ncbi:riboflavin-specific deaminase [Coprinopsis marcescibilis]|uniref:2,5-diamino-6-ribosylamino-4(3H)-pyrimidinone 5'-phosphate reductase n=1 Tax=Coprinopsis marcescibilis TaxID=230819 RepID=A0A5C3LDR3_COPMA|nr:riboflavin-specific deaminase [Coprinopsis marcescibilis]
MDVHPDKLDITITFAQSLDGKLAGPDGAQIALSCSESMQITHRLRSTNNAILVGANTAINDNPQLNTRLLPTEEQRNPQPVVLDTNLRLPPGCKLVQNFVAGKGLQPWLLTPGSDDLDWHHRRRVLENAGARIMIYNPNSTSHVDSIPSILSTLSFNGVSSLMVEGGPSVIQSFFTAHNKYGSIIDRIIITVAPMFVGEDGVGYNLPRSDGKPAFIHKDSFLAGKDAIMVLEPTSA